jgi:NUDIX domain
VNRRLDLPSPLQIVATVSFIFCFAIAVRLLFFSPESDVLREQAIYWFAIALIAAFAPWIKQIRWKDLEVKLTDIERKLEKLADRRYANLVYLLDRDGKLAVVRHRQYGLWIPCGTRLEQFEMPHAAVHRAVLDELGLEASRYRFWPENTSIRYGETEIVPRPYQVQVEKGSHREGIPYHYDFVYVCITNERSPLLRGSEDARWISVQELEHEVDAAEEGKPVTFPDVVPTFRKIVAELLRGGVGDVPASK